MLYEYIQKRRLHQTTYLLFLLLLHFFPFCSGFICRRSDAQCKIGSGSRICNNVIFASSNEKGEFDQDRTIDSTLSRRGFFSSPATLVGLGAYAYVCASSLKLSSRDEITYPKQHEEMVESVIATTFRSAADRFKPIEQRPFRVLEVGIGMNCRLIRRGLYDSGVKSLLSVPSVKSIELSGVDFRLPDEKIYQISKQKLETLTENGKPISFSAVDGSVTKR
jgi:hypothetical protein